MVTSICLTLIITGSNPVRSTMARVMGPGSKNPPSNISRWIFILRNAVFLAFKLFQIFFTDTNGLWGDFYEFIVVDVLKSTL